MGTTHSLSAVSIISIFDHIIVSYVSYLRLFWNMMTSWNGHRWIPLTKPSDAELCYFLSLNKRLSKQSRRRWFQTSSCPLWRHCNARGTIKTTCAISLWRNHINGDTNRFSVKSTQCVKSQWPRNDAWNIQYLVHVCHQSYLQILPSLCNFRHRMINMIIKSLSLVTYVHWLWISIIHILCIHN